MNTHTRQILLIESAFSDSPRTFAENLNGFVVTRRPLDGDEPAHFFADESFSAVLMNVATTFEHQLALVHRVRETVPHIPILVFAEEGDVEKAAQIFHAGAQDYLIKPWLQQETIPWAIQNAIERQRVWMGLQKKTLQTETDQRQLQTLIEKNADGILIVNQKGQVQFANPAAERLFDMNASQLLGMDFGFPVVSDDTIEIDIWQRGQPRYAEMRVVDITWQGENVFLVSLRDATERVLTEKRMRYLATHDALTDLPNRILFFDRLSHALAQAARQKSHVAIFFLDVDKFKQINDTYGHQVGDQILQALAFRLQDCLRKSDTVARMGGDEFTVILENVENPLDCVAVAKKVLEVVNTPFGIKKREFHLTASLGISIYPNDGEDGDLLLNHADTAMYKAKEYRGRFCFFNEALNP